MTEWTPALVEARLAEAADVLKRLPDERLVGYVSTWPRTLQQFSDLVGQKPVMRPAVPSPTAISRMEETLSWTVGLDPVDGRITWMRAFGARWKSICAAVGLNRSAAHQHWLYALCVIAFRLNGRRLNGKWSRRKVIELGRTSQGWVADSKVST